MTFFQCEILVLPNCLISLKMAFLKVETAFSSSKTGSLRKSCLGKVALTSLKKQY